MLSKGHAGPIVYTALAYKGYFPKEWLATINQDGTRLPSHVDQNLTPGIDMTAGSLGQGLSGACGMALAAKRAARTTACSASSATAKATRARSGRRPCSPPINGLDNLTVICDYNKLQIDGFTHEILNLEPLADKWRAFGWETFEIDGHDWDSIHDALTRATGVTASRP